MHPNGFFGLDSLRALLFPIALFGISFFVFYLRHEGIKVWRAVLLLILMAAVGLLGAKLFSLYTRGWELYQPLYSELRGGLRYPGALIAMVLLGPLLKLWLLPNLSVRRFLDVLAITVAFSFALVRISCLMNGCCTGPECDAWYCLSYAPGSQAWYWQLKGGLLASAADPSHPVLPLHLLFMGASFLVGMFLMWYDSRRTFDGQIALLYLALHDGAKAILESFRSPYVAELQATSATLSLVGIIALTIVFLVRRKRRQFSEEGV